MPFKFLFVILSLRIGVCISQTKDSIVNPKNSIEKDSIVNAEKQLTDAKIDSLFVKNLKDIEYVSKLDSIWSKDLVSTELYEATYKSISELTYDPVDYPELPTDTLKARLKELNSRTPFNVEYNPSLEGVIKWYLRDRRALIQRLISLSAFYFPMFEQELDKHDIPLELKYLAVVESALKPTAKSRVGASGLWQFMYATGKMYNLNVTSYVDDRNDPIKATEAASKYLSKLYKIFDDWDLALAAYNSGPGNVNKAIRRSGGLKNYWDLRPYLPRETAGYLPSFLANMYIFEYAKEHGFKKAKPELTYFETDTILVKKMITLEQVAHVTGAPLEQIQFLNPSYKLGIIPELKNKKYTLRLPIESVGKFVNNEASIYAYANTNLKKNEKKFPEFVKGNRKIHYRVKSGDYLGRIANRYGVRLSDLKKWNGLRSNTISVGQRLTVYLGKSSGIAKTTVSSRKTVTSKNATIHTVKSGDTLWSISQKYQGVSVENIKEWNGISSSKLKPGMRLKISKG